MIIINKYSYNRLMFYLAFLAFFYLLQCNLNLYVRTVLRQENGASIELGKIHQEGSNEKEKRKGKSSS